METSNSLKTIRKRCLVLANKAHDGNLQSVFSSLEIIWTLYDRIMDLNRIKTGEKDRDFFICSKGQATLGLLCVLAFKGFIDCDELAGYGCFDSRISMQADRSKFESGVEISAGSLGHGLPMAAGVAMSKFINKSKGNIYVLLGDGEMHEGTNWEACGFISYRGLNNIRLIIDDNCSHNYMYTNGSIEKRLDSFGFNVIRCNGNDVTCLERVIKDNINSKIPVAFIADTRRGYGSKTLMTKKEWFHKAPDDDELVSMLNEIDEFKPLEALQYVLSD